MRKPYERDIKKEILEQCFDYLVENGLEGTSINNLCKNTGISSGSIYYWFKDKDEIVMDAVEWGLDKHVNDIFDFAFQHADNLDELRKGIIKIAKDKKKEFRLIFQIATSPQYGDHVREIANKLENVYKKYTEVLSEKLTISFENLYPYVNLMVSAFVDCVICDDWNKLENELKCIIELMRK